MFRRAFLGIAASIALATALPGAALAAQETPEAFVERVANDVLQEIRNNPQLQKADKKAVEALVDRKMMPSVDFLRMTRMAVGPKLREATPAQREELQTLFRETLIQVYSGALTLAKDMQVKILPRGQNDGTEALIRTAMYSTVDKNQPETLINYRLRNIKDKGWRVIDINVEGVWLVSNYRNQYGSIAAQEGIDGLIRQMKSRLTDNAK